MKGLLQHSTFKIHHSLFFLFIIFFSSCISTKPPEFRAIENFQLMKLNPKAEYKLDVKLHNPNPIGARFSELFVKVMVFDSEMMIQNLEPEKSGLKIPANDDFVVYLNGETSFENASKVISAGLKSYFGGDADIPVNVSGYAVVKKFIFRKKIEFKFDEKFDLKKLQLPK